MPDKYFVADTNVLVSAAIFSSSVPNLCVNKILSIGKLVYSNAVLNEYSEIFLSSKFDKYISAEKRDKFLNSLLTTGSLVDVKENIKACRDPKDDKYLDLAIACGALCIVTGDKDLLVMHPFGDIPILTPSDFLLQF